MFVYVNIRVYNNEKGTCMRLNKEQVKNVYMTRGKVEIYKYQYFEHVIEIGALRLLGVKHRLIAELLNSHITDKIIDRFATSRMWRRWEELGYITDDLKRQIEIYAESLKRDDDEQNKNQTLFQTDSQWKDWKDV